jgi:sugar porter (SP) family MFS transporter
VNTGFTLRIAIIVALGGFLMGFDASVISGVVTFIEPEFSLTKIELGWAVASLTLTATLAMMLAGPLSDRFGRKPVLSAAAVIFAISAVASAFAPTFTWLVVARMLGGFGVGAALIVAPMYIAEVAPAAIRGRMVSINQLNIVVGISAAFFSNYCVLQLAQSDISWVQALGLSEWTWRWMLGLETLPAIIYFCGLFFVPESPRWLAMQGRHKEALAVLERVSAAPEAELASVQQSLEASDTDRKRLPLKELFSAPMRWVISIGLVVAVLQQITGINSVFFYAPMIFEQSGIGTDSAFMQAVLVGLTNLVFTLAAMALIDKLGRKPLLSFGVGGIAACMFLLAYGFGSATYTLQGATLAQLPELAEVPALQAMVGTTFSSDLDFKAALNTALGSEQAGAYEAQLLTASVTMNPTLILVGILGFVACFAISLGPVMWVLFSELFPNRIRALAISFVGLVNSAVSFLVQLVFPWELANIGNAGTFAIYGGFALVGLFAISRLLPETKGKSLEELEGMLVRG